ncbi:hypothetical protein OS189_16975 [Sulfitobacter sp. F26169L]|uniref:hypothetical protein n=1 Tax=Sulfitobacter sp. F26169L TaxID=2996015 RepID=UPI00226099AD|nr:hypothetical protein [Sulfitobacter sp. F26169L]MCX7568038.1 hypothetical protein [Sulfitobacter sp. F26169L]
MYTPYIITRIDSPDAQVFDVNIPDRVRIVRDCGNFRFYFFPPDHPKMLADLENRLHIHGENLWFEEGFMLRYPDPYQPDVSAKLDHFDLPSIALDGAYSRITVRDGVLKIDGSATYLQMMCSYTENGQFFYSNNQPALEDILALAGHKLTLNERFLASHLAQMPLAFFIFAGTQRNEIAFHDSVDTITYDGALHSEIHHKLTDPAIEALSRADRLDMLHARVQHTIDQYCIWTGTENFTHHLTAGRDSRMSLALFKETQKDRLLLLLTGGYPHTTDKVVANYVAKEYGITQALPKKSYSTNGFDYQAVQNTVHPYRYQVAMFRRQDYKTDFDPEVAMANGYLGNLMTYTGAKKKQMLPQEKGTLTPEAYADIDAIYDRHIEELSAAYGPENAFRMFNLKFNTTNKVSSVIGRLRKYFFCVFESDLLFLAYMLETPEDMHNNSIHYELIRRSDAALLNTIPFEPGKSFPEQGITSEISESKGIKRIAEHRKFIQLNYDLICAHIRDHAHHLPQFRATYMDEITDVQRDNIPVVIVKNMFALLGALELKGYPLKGFAQVAGQNNTAEDVYTMDFFQQMYFDGALHTSGLPGMVYTRKGVYRSFAKIPEGERLLVSIVSIPVEKPQKVTITQQDDGHTIHFEVERDSRYRVVHNSYSPETKRRPNFTALSS